MKQFRCADVVPGCEAAFRAETEDELYALGWRHAKAEHGLTEADATAELQAAVRATFRDVS